LNLKRKVAAIDVVAKPHEQGKGKNATAKGARHECKAESRGAGKLNRNGADARQDKAREIFRGERSKPTRPEKNFAQRGICAAYAALQFNFFFKFNG
jgi:hypothetical protein